MSGLRGEGRGAGIRTCDDGVASGGGGEMVKEACEFSLWKAWRGMGMGCSGEGDVVVAIVGREASSVPGSVLLRWWWWVVVGRSDGPGVDRL